MTTIEWTDETWNPVTGCDRVSPGCAHCYALDLAARLKAMGQPRYQRDGDPRTSGPGFGVTLHPAKLAEPLRWRKPRRVFVNSMSDLFHEEIPDEYIDRVFATMARAEHHTFQVLTKRPERALVYTAGDWRARIGSAALVNPGFFAGWPLPNVWLGVSVENARYTWRADVLREIPAAVRFISAEPLLGSLFSVKSSGAGGRSASSPGSRPAIRDSREGGQPGKAAPEPGCYVATPGLPAPLDLTGIDWLIVGGESGPHHRPMNPDWARELRDAAAANDTAFFFKQWGGRTPKAGGRLLDGRTWDDYPASQARAA